MLRDSRIQVDTSLYFYGPLLFQVIIVHIPCHHSVLLPYLTKPGPKPCSLAIHQPGGQIHTDHSPSTARRVDEMIAGKQGKAGNSDWTRLVDLQSPHRQKILHYPATAAAPNVTSSVSERNGEPHEQGPGTTAKKQDRRKNHQNILVRPCFGRRTK
jgi:hypothetical protein